MRRKLNSKKWVTTILALALTGAGCAALGGKSPNYPIAPIPDRPALEFKSAGEQCIATPELRALAEYDIELRAAALKNLKTLEIINNGN